MSGFCLKACSFKTLQRKSPCHPLPAQSKVPLGTSPPTKSCCPLRITVAYLASVCVSKCPARSALSSSSGCCALACPCAWLGRTCAAQPQLSASLQLPRCGGTGGGGAPCLATWLPGLPQISRLSPVPHIGGVDPRPCLGWSWQNSSHSRSHCHQAPTGGAPAIEVLRWQMGSPQAPHPTQASYAPFLPA